MSAPDPSRVLVTSDDPRLSDARPPSAHKHAVPADLTTTGTASSSTYLRGDGTWQTPPNSQYNMLTTSEITGGTDYAAKLISAERLKGAVQRWATGSYTSVISAIGQALNKAATAAEARTAIGAGTSNLAIGTTASTAKAGNWTPGISQVTGLDTALAGKVIASGAATTLWAGSQSAYDALPTSTRNAIGFIAVIV